MNRLRTIIRCRNPKILLITPLRVGDKVSKDTKKSIKRNKLPIEWVSYQDKYNAVQNTKMAYDKWVDDNGTVPYVMKIDNDIIASRGMIDALYQSLESSDDHIAYSYCSFEFTGSIMAKFPLRDFDSNAIKKHNYISSCSLIKTDKLESIGGFIVDDKYRGLLDWCLWLKFLTNGLSGIPTKKAHFTARSDGNGVSSWKNGGYEETRDIVIKTFVIP